MQMPWRIDPWKNSNIGGGSLGIEAVAQSVAEKIQAQ
jgi:hypothetical protein